MSLLSSSVPFVCILQESLVLVPPEIRYRFVLLFLCRLAERLMLLCKRNLKAGSVELAGDLAMMEVVTYAILPSPLPKGN